MVGDNNTYVMVYDKVGPVDGKQVEYALRTTV